MFSWWKGAAMTANSVFIPIRERGWRRGLGNLLRAGFGQWWGTRSWWVHTVIWTGVLGLLLAGILSSGESVPLLDAVGAICLFGGLFPVIAMVIIMQGAIVGEKQNGTAEWILAKPVSRTAYILGKLLPNAVGVLVTMLLIPMVVAWLLLWFVGVRIAVWPYLGGYLIVALNMLFFLSLTVMLGAMLKRRGGVIGIPMACLIGQQYLVGAAPVLAKVLPWGLCLPLGNDMASSVAGAVMAGAAPPSWLPVITTSAATIVFVVVAVWRFREVEL